MSGHRAEAYRQNGPGRVWFVRCHSCPGWRPAVSDKLDAQRVAAIHNWRVGPERRLLLIREAARKMPCRCHENYDPEAMEYGTPAPCDKCSILDLTGVSS